MVLTVIGAIFMFYALMKLAYENRGVSGSEIPVIKADDTPFKVYPPARDGIVENAMFFDAISGDVVRGEGCEETARRLIAKQREFDAFYVDRDMLRKEGIYRELMKGDELTSIGGIAVVIEK